MDEIIKELLEDISIGDHVRLRHGTSDLQTEVEGIVQIISDHTIKLQKQDGKSGRIRLEDIRSIELIDANEGQRPDTPQPHNVSLIQTPVVSFAAMEKRVMRNFVSLPSALPFEFNRSVYKEQIKELLRKTDNREFIKIINSVSSSVEAAIKNHDLKEKYHNARARILREWNLCQSDVDYEIFYLFLGTMAIIANQFDNDAIEALVRAKRYSLAAYAAIKGERHDDADILSLCALLSKETSEITQFTSTICLAKRDTDVLRYLLQMYKDNPEQCEAIASCVVQVFLASEGTLSGSITPYHSAYDAANQMLDAIPTAWKKESAALKYWNRFKAYRYPVNSTTVQNDYLVGNIKKYDPAGKWGFITPKPFTGSDQYFYVAQVLTDTENGVLMRKALQCGEWNQLEVFYELGNSPIYAGRSSATAIELTEAGAKSFLQKLSLIKQNEDDSKAISGTISRYDRVGGAGTISARGMEYRFNLHSVVDPWLKAYLENCAEILTTDVLFDISSLRAQNIRRAQLATEIFYEYEQYVSEKDKDVWDAFLAECQEKSRTMWLEDIDPYSSFPYVDLAPYEETPKRTQLVPFSWTQDSMDESLSTPVHPLFSRNEQRGNQLHAIPIHELPPNVTELDNTALGFVGRARKAMVEGRLEDAERAFEKALEGGGYNEGAVCDYITLCMRQNGRIDRAIQLLRTYGTLIPSEKLLNLKISVYEKKKDYKELCALYEEAFRTSPSVTKQSHSLYRLVDAYIKLEEYSKALSTCTQWEAFYHQNQYGSDGNKIQSGVHSIERKKAICLYHLGRRDEAKQIATGLLRINPTDSAANSIMAETLGDYNPEVEDSSSDYRFDQFDRSENRDSRLSPFVRYRIQEVNLSNVLKSPNIRDGKYIGSDEDRQKDIEVLITRRRISAQTRSDSLFAACKLIDQADLTFDQKEAQRKYRYAGRAMAAWGDSMISQASQLDTTRMAYLYALRTLTPTKAGSEQGWIDAYNRYIKSFFLAQHGTNSLEEYVNEQNNRNDHDAANTDVLVGSSIPNVLLREFLNGVLMLINAIDNQKDRQFSFAYDLYDRNTELRKSIYEQLSEFLDSQLPKLVTRKQFCETLLSASEMLKQKVQLLNTKLAEISSVLLLQPLSSEQLEDLEPGRWLNCLTATDGMRLSTIFYRIVKRSQDYYGSGEFESRAECIRAILLEVDKLQEGIYKEPTDISYEILLPSLSQMKIRLLEKQDDLYQVFLPKITLEETIPPFRSPNGEVQIHFTVRNGQNYQAAEAFQITEIKGPEVVRSGESPVVQTLRGGGEEEVSLSVKLNDTANAIGSFTAMVSYIYKYSDAPQSIITKRQDISLTFIIKSENFQPLINPFAAYEEHIMEDEGMFFGREELATRIMDKIRTPDGRMNYGGAVALYGQTRTGKSSLLYHLQSKLLQRFGDDVVIWDMGNIGEQEVSQSYLNNFFYSMLDIGHEAILENDVICQKVEEAGITPPLDAILQSQGSASTLFAAYMRKLNAILREENKIIILFLDEFTYLHGYMKNGRLPAEFMHFWKALLEKNCIFAIIAGQDDMPEFVRENQNDFGVMELIKLNYLAKQDTKDLIQKPLEDRNHRKGLFRDDGGVDELYDLTAGSAYLTIILCSKLVGYINEKGAYTITKGIINDYIHTRVLGPHSFLLDKHFEPQIDERGREDLHQINAEILLSIARLSKTAGYARLSDITCGDKSTEEIQTYLERLVDRNVLLREGRDGYRIYVKLLEKWLVDTKGA